MGGCFGLKATTPGRVTSREIEAARKAVMRSVRRTGKFWIRIFPDVPVSSKPAEVRMGKGKGSVDYWACRVDSGRMIFEMNGVDLEVARKAFALAAAKLSVRTKFVQALDSGMLVGGAS
jgi:large subunit ribosomal protein L16